MAAAESRPGAMYRRIYEACCGKHPDLHPWHFQWLTAHLIHRPLKAILPALRGRVLDVGCGNKPYRQWLSGTSEYTGLDVFAGPSVDVVVEPDKHWPLPDGQFDVVLSTQMLEFAPDADLTLHEMKRVLKPGGTIVLTFPFIYNEHRPPFDLQRFTVHRALTMFSQFDVRVERQGGIGSTMTILLLNWVELSLNRNRVTRVIKALLLPLWIPVSLVMNLAALLIDQVDGTGAFYSNVLVVAQRR